MDKLKGGELIILLMWFIGNILIYASAVYISFYLANGGKNNLDTWLIQIIGLFWLWGQIKYAKPNFKGAK